MKKIKYLLLLAFIFIPISVKADTIYDITLEQSMVAEKAGFFESVYGLRPVLRVKKR